MQRQGQPEKHHPEQHAPTTNNKEHYSYYRKRNIVTAGKPAVVRVVHQIRCIVSDRGCTVILRRAPQYPTHGCPPPTIAWRMWITCLICMRMVYAVRHYPLNWTTFKSHCGASHQKVFNQLRHLVTAVGQ